MFILLMSICLSVTKCNAGCVHMSSVLLYYSFLSPHKLPVEFIVILCLLPPSLADKHQRVAVRCDSAVVYNVSFGAPYALYSAPT